MAHRERFSSRDSARAPQVRERARISVWATRGGVLLALLLTWAVAVALAPVTGKPKAGAFSDHSEVRGVTISCQTWGWEWGTDGFAHELDDLAELGVNWIAIHPYAGIRADGSLNRWHPVDPSDPPAWIARPLEETRERGMALLVKPHLAYWGSPFDWRGEIDFPEPEARARFFADYEAWMRDLARATRSAAAFVVGTELDGLTAYEDEWRRVIEAVRAETPATLTFASNWDAFERVPFWDALDAVGVQAYFPLSEEPDPSEAALRAGWTPVLDSLRTLSERTGKPVVFTELGYDCSVEAARSPWRPRAMLPTETARAPAVQKRCLETALEILADEREWLRGAFLWKWFVGDAPGEDFVLDTPGVRSSLRARWGRR